jgi:hypothetical protein
VGGKPTNLALVSIVSPVHEPFHTGGVAPELKASHDKNNNKQLRKMFPEKTEK